MLKKYFFYLLLSGFLVGCGQSGSLYLPKKAPETVVAPQISQSIGQPITQKAQQ